MKNYIVLILLVSLMFVGCAGSGGGSNNPPSNPGTGGGVTSRTYVYQVQGAGIEFAGALYTNFGEADQAEYPVAQHVISGAGYEDATVYGRTTLGQFVLRSSGTLTVLLYKDGQLVDQKSTSTINDQINIGEGL